MKQEQDRLGWKLIITVTVVVLAVWGASWILTDWLISDASTRGAFGDKFGAVNALFSGLAFAGLIVTLVLQMKELRLQRDELACTREELKGQKVELAKQSMTFEAQNKAINQQRFENTFFNLLKNHREIERDLPQGLDATRSVMIPFFSSAYFHFGKSKIPRLKNGRTLSEGEKLACKIALRDLNQKIESPVTWSYYALLYRIIKFVDESDFLAGSQKYSYICILRAQLSYYELWGLFYHCLNDRAQEKFKPLIEKYALFNNLDLTILNFPEDKEKYELGAYEYTPR